MSGKKKNTEKDAIAIELKLQHYTVQRTNIS